MKSEKTTTELIEMFLQDQDVNNLSRREYKIYLKRWLFYCVCQKIDVRNPRRADVIAYKSFLQKQGKAVCTVDIYLSTVKRYFGWLEDQGIYSNIAAGVHSPKRYKGHRKGYLHPDQVTAMLNKMPKVTIIDLRNFAIVNMMVRSGIRRIELQRMNVGDLKVIEGNPIVKLQRKGRVEKDSNLGLTCKIVDPINDYLCLRESANDNEPMFINHCHFHSNQRISVITISRIIKKALKNVGVDDSRITAHSLRHTAAITALRAGASLLDVQQMLGHSSMETTRLYLTAIDEELKLNNPAIHSLDDSF